MSERLGLDTRVTTLGHTQRGGRPCAYDRILVRRWQVTCLTRQATLQGVDAIEAVLAATPDTPSPIIGMEENHITRKPLMEAVRLVRRGLSHRGLTRADPVCRSGDRGQGL